jgi:GT2 family glycosyltransferase
MQYLDWAAWIIGGGMLGMLGVLHRNSSKLDHLPEVPTAPTSHGSVCLCIPARNEAEEIGGALDSWLAQDYPDLHIIVVDDGSSDGTTGILKQRAGLHLDRLRVLRNDSLPEGWLGKNHALHLAVQQPEAMNAQWLLFVDADVHASPDLLRRVFAYLDEKPADILALIFAVDAIGLVERVAVPLAVPGFLILVPPHQVPNPRHLAFAGIGAFTLLTRSAYDGVGGHAAAPLEAVDDMMLARRVKKAGYINRLVCGGPMLHLRMYRGLVDLIRGMRKNTAALPGWWLIPIVLPLLLMGYLAPMWLPLAGHPVLGFFIWLLTPVIAGDASQRITGKPMDWIWVFWPIIGLILAAGMLWAFLDRVRGVNTWRGRRVELKEIPPG